MPRFKRDGHNSDFPERPFLFGTKHWRRVTSDAIYVTYKRINRRFQTLPLLIYWRWTKSTRLHSHGRIVAICEAAGNSGMARSYRYEIEALRSRSKDLIVLDATQPPHVSQAILAGLHEPIRELHFVGGARKLKTFLRHFTPAQIAHSRRIGYWVYEAPIVPRSWKLAFRFVHDVITPSEFSAQAIRRRTDTVAVTAKPHPVATIRPQGQFDFTRLGCHRDAFIGLSIAELACPARKNPWAVIAAWKRAFAGDVNTVLIMKLRFTRASQIVRQELAEMIGTDQNIVIHEIEYSDTEMATLQASANVYLSLHRAEGYGLTIHESLELGVPTIATHWSANTEYGPHYPNYFPCTVTMIPYHDWTYHYQIGPFEWAEADIDSVVAQLHTIYAHWKATRGCPSQPLHAG